MEATVSSLLSIVSSMAIINAIMFFCVGILLIVTNIDILKLEDKLDRFMKTVAGVRPGEKIDETLERMKKELAMYEEISSDGPSPIPQGKYPTSDELIQMTTKQSYYKGIRIHEGNIDLATLPEPRVVPVVKLDITAKTVKADPAILDVDTEPFPPFPVEEDQARDKVKPTPEALRAACVGCSKRGDFAKCSRKYTYDCFGKYEAEYEVCAKECDCRQHCIAKSVVAKEETVEHTSANPDCFQDYSEVRNIHTLRGCPTCKALDKCKQQTKLGGYNG